VKELAGNKPNHSPLAAITPGAMTDKVLVSTNLDTTNGANPPFRSPRSMSRSFPRKKELNRSRGKSS
jgi:hypothetical protein